MKNENIDIELLNPKEQLLLYGYDEYFQNFVNLFEAKKLPNSLLISGAKGIGKCTFIYHFINFLLSKNEKVELTILFFISWFVETTTKITENKTIQVIKIFFLNLLNFIKI